MLAEIARWSGGMMFFTAVFVLTSMGLGTLSSVRYVKSTRTQSGLEQTRYLAGIMKGTKKDQGIGITCPRRMTNAGDYKSIHE